MCRQSSESRSRQLPSSPQQLVLFTKEPFNLTSQQPTQRQDSPPDRTGREGGEGGEVYSWIDALGGVDVRHGFCLSQRAVSSTEVQRGHMYKEKYSFSLCRDHNVFISWSRHYNICYVEIPKETLNRSCCIDDRLTVWAETAQPMVDQHIHFIDCYKGWYISC